jgi:hypothetical protein
VNNSTPLKFINRAQKGSGRWLVVAAIIAMLSLQVVAVDHWHGADDTQHCEMCLHAHDAPIFGEPGRVVPLGQQQNRTPCTISAYSVGLKQGTGNRDPPNLS